VTERLEPTQSQDEGRRGLDFDSVYQSELRYVWNTLRRLGVRARDLEDLTHDVFIVVFRRQEEFQTGRAIRPWLFGISFRIASDYRRSARFQREVEGENIDLADDAPSAEDQVATNESRKLVLEALETLDFDRRAVFVMHDLDGHSMPEIHDVLSVPLNTLYSRLRLARQDFAAAVRRIRARGGER
jgi:RNA polymerase sigma-70 factor (ECF subfamily)